VAHTALPWDIHPWLDRAWLTSPLEREGGEVLAAAGAHPREFFVPSPTPTRRQARRRGLTSVRSELHLGVHSQTSRLESPRRRPRYVWSEGRMGLGPI
jgi:hypothetical protein